MKIFVSCGASDIIAKSYKDVAIELGDLMIKHNHDLVFGSSKCGLMGIIYDKIKNSDRKVITVLPKKIVGFLSEVDCDEKIIAESVADHVLKLLHTADAMIVLPGALGMLAEISLALHLKKYDELSIPIIIVNANGFFNDYLNMLNHINKENFSIYPDESLYNLVDNSASAIEILENMSKSSK